MSNEELGNHVPGDQAAGEEEQVNQKPPNQNEKPSCPNCGQGWHIDGMFSCPAYQQRCCLCENVGHFAEWCRIANPRLRSSGGQ